MKKLLLILTFSILFLSIIAMSINAINPVNNSNNNVDYSKAYFKVNNHNALNSIKGIKKFDFNNNVVSVSATSNKINDLKKNKDLEFLGYVNILKINSYSSMSKIINDDTQGGGASVNRACTLSQYGLPQVNWDIQMIYQNPNLTSIYVGKNVRVAVLDTGANINNPDIANRVKSCLDFTKYPVSSTCEDDNPNGGHGTAVASIIAADSGLDNKGIYGMDPKADLYIYKVCSYYNESKEEGCPDDVVAAAIIDATNRGVNIITISFGGPIMSSTLKSAIDYAAANNVLLVGSAGNDGVPVEYPAAYVKVVSVGSIDNNYQPMLGTAIGNNYVSYIRQEKDIEFGAPGVGILAATSNGCYGYYTGTSFAAPHVAGLAALTWTGSAVTTRLNMQNNARLHDLWIPGYDNLTGFGLPTVKIPNAEDNPVIDINPRNSLPIHPGLKR